MNKKNLNMPNLGALHQFAADAVYPRKPRQVGDQQAVETLSVDSQLQEFVVRAMVPKKPRKIATESTRRLGGHRKKLRSGRDS